MNCLPTLNYHKIGMGFSLSSVLLVLILIKIVEHIFENKVHRETKYTSLV